jgi:ribosome recycling factor
MAAYPGFIAGCGAIPASSFHGARLRRSAAAASAAPVRTPASAPRRTNVVATPRRAPTTRRTTTTTHAAAEPAAGQDVKAEAERRMQKTLDATASAFNTIRTGRASGAILDRVTVDYYGVETPLNNLAGISVQGSSTIIVDPYDKSAIKDMERALMESDVGITPSNDGAVIRLNVPPLTQERRKDLVKQVKALAEDGRVAIRNIRRDAVDKCKKTEKDGDLGKDESKDLQDAVQKATDKFVKKIDDMLKNKEKDILTV